MTPEPIAIIGLSALFPGSPDAGAFWRTIVRGVDCVTEIPDSHWLPSDFYDPDPHLQDKTYCKRGAFLSPVLFDPLKYGIPPANLSAIDTVQLLALVLADQVIDDAVQGSFELIDREKVSVILGVAGTTELTSHMSGRMGHPQWAQALRDSGMSDAQVQEICSRIAAYFVPWQENTFPGLLSNVVAGRIANRFNLGGTNCVVDAACASSLAAVSMGINELRLGQSDMAIVGGADALNDILMYLCFSKTPALSPTGDCRPFSDAADGTILGEGMALMALRRLDDAERDGNRIYAVIRGIGSSSDGRSTSIYAPRAEGQSKALRRAYAFAGYSPHTVGLVEAHGTGTAAGDKAEFAALRAVFEEDRQNAAPWCALGSIKSQIGHTKGAAGIAGLAKAVLALHHQVLPPTIKVEQPNPALQMETSPFYLNTQARPWIRRQSHPRRASVSSFGFGGSNFHVALEEYSGTAARPPRFRVGPTELFLFSGDSTKELLNQVTELVSAASELGLSSAIQGQAKGCQLKFDCRAPHRLAIVAADMTDLRTKRTQVAEILNGSVQGGAPGSQEIFYGTGASTEKVCFLFPGQGSQYLGMGLDLAMAFDVVRQTWDEAANISFEPGVALHDIVFPPPSFSDEEFERRSNLLKATERAQPAIAACSLSMLNWLRALGIRPDAVAGHSLGELTALYAAGVYDESAFLSVARRRGELMKTVGPTTGTMLAVALSDSQLKPLLQDHDDVVIANFNSPRQTVVSGPVGSIEGLMEELRVRQVVYSRLNVANAFHSPHVSAASAGLESYLAEIPWRIPNVPIYANSNAEIYPSDVASGRKLLARQLAEPVRFQSSIERLYSDSVRVFLEVGPNSHLTGLVEQCLSGRPHTAIALDRQGRHGVTQAWKALGRLAVSGVSVTWNALWEGIAIPTVQPVANGKGGLVEVCGANLGKPYPPRHRGKTDAVVTIDNVRPDRSKESVKSRFPEASASATIVPALAQDSPRPKHSSWQSDLPAEIAIPPTSSLVSARHDTTKFPSTLARRGHSAAPEGPPINDHQPNQFVAPSVSGMSPSFCGAIQELQQQSADVQQAFLKAIGESQQAYLQTVNRLISLAGNDVQGIAQTVDVWPAINSSPRHEPAMPKTVTSAISEGITVPTQSVLIPRTVHTTDKHDLASNHGTPESRLARTGLPATAVRSTPSSFVVSEAEAPSESSSADILLSIVAEKTGYPLDTLNLEMDIEADLGIDSIKRVEILGALMSRHPGLSDDDATIVNTGRTLQEILELIQVRVQPANTPLGSPAPSVASVESAPIEVKIDAGELVLQIVAEKTGYPREALDLDKEIEADLGIDSIKRVEILSSLTALLPDLHDADVSQVGSMRTLAELAAYLELRTLRSASIEARSKPTFAESHTSATIPVEGVEAIDSVNVRREVVAIVDCPSTGFSTPGLFRPNGLVLVPNSQPDRSWHVADALATLLRARGIAVHVATEISESTDHVIFLGGIGNIDTADEAFQVSRHAFQLARELGRHKSEKRLFITVQDTGGAWGLGHCPPERAWLGGLAGLVKTLGREWPSSTVRAIDLEVAGRTVEELAQTLFEELSTGGAEIEIGLRADGSRCTTMCIEDVLQPSSANRFSENMVVVASGGARGVTAASLRALAGKCPIRLVLLGRTPLDAVEPACCHALEGEAALKQALVGQARRDGEQISIKSIDLQVQSIMACREVRQCLLEFEQLASQVRYVSVDVTDAAAVHEALSKVRSDWGPIQAVIHGAGVLADRRIEDKTNEQFDQVFFTKVRGLSALLQATQDDPMELLVVFSSVAARYGNAGQSDYAMANETLNKVAQAESRRRGPSCVVKAINWGPWDSGMVGPGLKLHFEKLGVPPIPLRQGGQIFLDEIQSRSSDAVEVVVCGQDVDHCRSAFLPQSPDVDLRVSLSRFPFLDSHRIKQVPVLPIVLVLEWFARTASSHRRDLVLTELRDLRVLKGVQFLDAGCETNLSIRSRDISCNGSTVMGLELTGPNGLVHYSGIAEMIPASIARTNVKHSVKPAVLTDAGSWPWSIDDAYDRLFHGVDFQVLHSLDHLSPQGATASLHGTADKEWPGGPWQVDMAAIDGAFQLGLLWGLHKTGRMSLPTRLGACRLLRPSGRAPYVCELRVKEVTRHSHVFDFHLTDVDGTLVAEVSELEMALLPSHEGSSLR